MVTLPMPRRSVEMTPADPDRPVARVEFPAWLVGDAESLRHRIDAEGQRWAARHAETGSFPEPGLVPVAPGSLVYVADASDLSPRRLATRLYLVPLLRGAIQEARGWRDTRGIAVAFETQLQSTCWGGLALMTTFRGSAPVESVRARFRSVSSCWEELSALRYVGIGREPVTLDQLIRTRLDGLLRLWRPGATGDTRADVEAALDAVAGADDGTRADRVAEWLAGLAGANARIRHSTHLADPEYLGLALEDIGREDLETLATGSASMALRVLYDADRRLVAGAGQPG